MNKLSTQKRVQVISALVEGNSVIDKLWDIEDIVKLLEEKESIG